MRLHKLVPKSPRGVFGTLILAPMLYAGFVLASTPAHAARVSDKLLCMNPTQISCQSGDCYLGDPGTGECCTVIRTYECSNGGTIAQEVTECGAQC
jgi:hypothetical protein